MSELNLKDTITCCELVANGTDDIDERLICERAGHHLKALESDNAKLEDRIKDMLMGDM